MNTRRLRHLLLVSAAILVLNQSYSGMGNQGWASFQNELPWVTFAPAGEEFTMTLPQWPTVRTYPVSSPFHSDREPVLAHREYGGYGSGVVFIIECYKARRPQRLWSDFGADASGTFERDISFDGVVARQYRSAQSSRYATYTRRIVRFATKEHIYFVTLVTLEDTNPFEDRLLSSLRLRRADDRITTYERSSENILGHFFLPTEVTRKAIIVSKTEPFYTPQARANQIVGAVVLEATLAEDGYVSNIAVTRGLKDGLTESAIEAARSIRFFPAEKDGKPVSQRMTLEYNFNLF